MRTLTTIILLLLSLSLINCRGPRGDQGSVGLPGQSIVGPAGADGTEITLVKLCPESPSYGTFVEYAECINGQLWGIYSQNGGFLTLLSDGNYTSNGIGSSCNLTVRGCMVTH